jgi:hypothetical protein
MRCGRFSPKVRFGGRPVIAKEERVHSEHGNSQRLTTQPSCRWELQCCPSATGHAPTGCKSPPKIFRHRGHSLQPAGFVLATVG